MSLDNLLKKLEYGSHRIEKQKRLVSDIDDKTKKLMSLQEEVSKKLDIPLEGVPTSAQDIVDKARKALEERKSIAGKMRDVVSNIDVGGVEDVGIVSEKRDWREPERFVPREDSINPDLEVAIGTDARKAKRLFQSGMRIPGLRDWREPEEQMTPEQRQYREDYQRLEEGKPLEPIYEVSPTPRDQELIDKIKSGQELTPEEIQEAKERRLIESPETTGRTTTGSIKAGFGDVLSSAGGVAQWLGEKTGIEGLTRVGEEMQERGERTAHIWGTEYDKDFSWKSFLDPKFYATTVARSAPFMVSLYPGMIAGYMGGSAIGAARGLGAFGRTILGSLGATAASRPIESALEAGAIYNEAKRRGMSEKEAEQAANEVFKKNMALAAADVGQLITAFSPIPGKLASLTRASTKLGKAAQGIARLGLTAGQEAAEEGYQEYIQRSALGDEFNLNDPEVKQAMAIGAIYGGGMGGAGATYNFIKGRTIATMSPEQRSEFETKVAEKKEEGKPIEVAAQEALDEYAETEEGKRHIEKVVEEITGEETAVEESAGIAKQPETTEQTEPIEKHDTEDKKTLFKNKLRVKKTRTKKGQEVWEVSGNTKEHKNTLKKLGGKWYGPKKVWSFYGADPTAKIAEALSKKKEEPSGKIESKEVGKLDNLRNEAKRLIEKISQTDTPKYTINDVNSVENREDVLSEIVKELRSQEESLTEQKTQAKTQEVSPKETAKYINPTKEKVNEVENNLPRGYEVLYIAKKDNDDNIKFEPVAGKMVNLVDGIDTFIHRTNDGEGWVITEAKTGLAITMGRTQEEVKEEAKKLIESKRDVVENKIKSAEEENGLSPKYQKKGGKESAERTVQSRSVWTDGKESLEEAQTENVSRTREERGSGKSTESSRGTDRKGAGQNIQKPAETVSTTEKGYAKEGSTHKKSAGHGMGSREGGVDTSARREGPATVGNKPGELELAGRNYRITEEDNIGEGGAKTKFKDNIKAIKTLKQIESEERMATQEEQKILVKYVGWGGLPQAFDENNSKWAKEYKELKELLTDKEYKEARASTLNAHYTSPEVIKAMYGGLKHLGFDSGKILEPGMGIGHFFGLMPPEMAANSSLIGVEIDSITGRIAKQLYQNAEIHVKGFQDVKIADNSIDVAISNVPFSDVGPYDPKYKKYKFGLHDYFFAKAIDSVHPGGLVMFITSTGTMDKVNTSVRKYIAERADLLGAVRLPGDAFKKNALTEVTTDIIVLRKKVPGEKSISKDWINVVETDVKDANGKKLKINEYYKNNPEMLLGEIVDDKLHPGRVALKSDGRDIGKAVEAALKNLPENVYSKKEPEFVIQKQSEQFKEDDVPEFGYFIKNNKVYRKYGGEIIEVKKTSKSNEPVTPKSKRFHRIKGMLEIRDVLNKLIDLQMSPKASETEIEAQRKKLNQVYDKFYKKYGAISNPYTNASMANGMGGDPSLPRLMSIEEYDERTKTAKKGDIFRKRTMKPPEPIRKADTPEEALTITLAEKGKIDFKRMAELTGITEEDLQKDLSGKGHIYKNPVGGWETASQYLSGNVREKLKIAREYAKKDSQYKDNVEALEQVQPRDLKPGEIYAKLGSPWIPTKYVEQFIDHLMGDSGTAKVKHSINQGLWTVDAHPIYKNSIAATSKWGTKRVDAIKLIEQALNHKRPVVRDQVDEKTVVNPRETAAAQQKQDDIKAEFERWLWKDAERTNELVKMYNENYNNLRLRSYDGSHLEFPGMNTGIELMKHQKDAVWRILQGGNTLLAHVVGAGKTYTMAAAGMEAKRMGLANKPLYVVPNHLLEQFTKDFYKLYPGAKILSMGGTDIPTHRISRRKAEGETETQFEERRLVNSAKRQTIMEKIRTGDWDAIIVTQEAFTKLPVSPEYENQFIEEQIEEITQSIKELKEAEGKSDSRIVKQLERTKKSLEKKMKEDVARERKDIGTPFEELGIDMLFVDEAHYYKNLQYATKMTRVAGLPNAHSQRAFDMFMKTQWITRRNNGRGVVFATGTPISNSMAEMFTMQRYLQMDELRKRGLYHFDSWAANFGEAVQVPEVSPTGKGFRIKTKFTKFVNVPELMQMFRQFADVQTIETLDLPRPELRGGEREKIIAPSTPELDEYVDELVARAEDVRNGNVDPQDDNMLKITGDGRKAALDMRLIDPSLPDNPDSKVNICVRKVYEIWNKYKNDKAAQLVFLDLSTPKGKDKVEETTEEEGPSEFDISIYQDIRNKLIKKGVPEREIAFIHEANTDAKKMKLFNAVNDGRVRILLGSTEKMGAGMNVQERLVALHHLDAPWRPSDVEQREGRILRRGNMYKEKGGVHIFYYATEQSFDARMWDIIASKAKMINQVMTGKVDARTVEDTGEATLTYEMMVAEASGNPLIKEKFEVDQEVQRLLQLKKAYDNARHDLQNKFLQNKRAISYNKEMIELYKKDISTRQDTRGDKFSITINGKKYTDRKKAAAAIWKLKDKYHGSKEGKTDIGKYAGFDISLKTFHTKNLLPKLIVKGAAEYVLDFTDTSTGTLMKLENNIRNIDKKIETAKAIIQNAEKENKDISAELEQPFEHEDQLVKLQKRQAEINKELNLDGGENVAGLEGEEETEYDSYTALEKPKRYTDIKIKKSGNFKELTEDDLSIQDSLPDKYVNQIRKLPEGIEIPNKGYVIELFNAARELMSPARYKKLRTRRELGAYTPGKKIELQTITNLVTMAHELGHAFDYNMNDGKFPQNINSRFEHGEKKKGLLERNLRKELKKASNFMRPHPGGANKFDAYRSNHKELMADFYALYLLDPQKAKRMAPTVYKLVEDKLNTKDNLKSLVEKVKSTRNLKTDDKLKLKDLKLVEEPLTVLPEEITNPTDATKELVKNISRIHRAMVHESTKRVNKWKKLLSEEELEDVGAAVEGIGNLRTGKTAEEVKNTLTDKQKLVLKEYRYYQERERERINKFLESTGEKEYISYIEDYLAHFYVGSPKKRKQFVSKWIKHSPNAKRRVFPTFQEAVEAGFTPLTQNVAELYQKWAVINWRVAVNRRFVYELRHIVNDDGQPVIQKPGKAPEDWPVIDHPAIRQVYARKKKDGTIELWHGGAAIDPEVYKIVRQVLEQPFTNNVVKAVEMFNAYAKKAALSISLFHHWALTESAQAALASIKNPLRGIILIGSDKETAGTGTRIPFTNIKLSRPHRAGMKLMEDEEFSKDAITHGLVVDEAPDVHIGKVKKMLQTIEAKTAKIPGLGHITRKIRQANDWWDTQLWTKYHNGLKAYTYYSLVSEALSRAPENISESDIKTTKEKIAELINDMYGGQEWASKFWLTPRGRQAVHIAFLAPNWTMSAFNVATKTFTQIKNPIARRYLARYWRNMFATLGGLIVALNIALSGRPPWENEPGHKDDIDVTAIMKALPWIDDTEKRRYYMSPGKQVKEVFRYLENPIEILGAKLSPAVHTIFEQWTGHQAGSGWPMDWEWEELTFYESLPLRLKSVMEKFVPFALRGNNFAFTFPMSRGMSAWKAQKAFEDLIKANVDPSITDKFKRKITGKETRELAKELIEACKLNGLDYVDMIRQANTKVRTEYYSKIWEAIDKQKFEEADKYAKILVKLGATPKTLVQSGKRRDKEKESITRALKYMVKYN